VGVCLFQIAYWGANYFTGSGYDESVLYHVEYGLTAAGFTEYLGVISTSFSAALACVALVIVIIFIKKTTGNGFCSLPFVLLLASPFIHPGTWQLRELLLPNFHPLAVFAAAQPEAAVPDFNEYYHRPQLKAAGTRKNLVYIYAESLERTYFDEKLFPDLVVGLRQLESQSTSFTNIKQSAYTGWTVAGMVASQCGIPLVTPSHGNSMSGMDSFLSSAVCLGDPGDQGHRLRHHPCLDHLQHRFA
jgi:phosphoglycerol transferase